jgi:glycosyltransferase involved in cell wall biosynthesis
MTKIAIIGTVGIPSGYGGFETLAENLAKYHFNHKISSQLFIYCSSKDISTRDANYLNARLCYIGIKANGFSSVAYDAISLISAILKGVDTVLILGVSGAIAIPLVRLFSSVRIVTNIDGVEWKRNKWKGLAKTFLKLSERIAVYFSHEIISDNIAIAEHVFERYGATSQVFAYGGDHAYDIAQVPFVNHELPKCYALALCRIEPENSVLQILETFARNHKLPLVFIGNWNVSPFSRKLKKDYEAYSNIYLIDPIYDLGILRSIRNDAVLYVHGHSAGGTNPSLVEMMHFGIPIFAYDCIFNKYTTHNKALYFSDVTTLDQLINVFSKEQFIDIGLNMQRIARQVYTWNFVGAQYFELLVSGKNN